MSFSQVYLTTSIPYVNGSAHVGHAQELIITDTLARLYRRLGFQTLLQTGTDENAFKNVISARALGIDPLTFVTQNSARFRELADSLQVSYQSFLRTTETRHQKGVHLFWNSLQAEDLITKSYKGLYCQGCEDFYVEKDLQNGLCPDHLTAPQAIAEENVYFRLSKYQKRLEHLIVTDQIKITPASRKNEVLGFIRGGLQDISLTRDAQRSEGWGIGHPHNPRQVIYVWIDALVNYLSGLGYGDSENWRSVWNDETWKIHVIGKNVWKFHAVYWPALLLSAGLPLPNEIVIHGFLTEEGQKISKSRGNGVAPQVLIEKYGADALRNYLLTELSIFGDSDLTEKGLRQSYHSDLANNLGNLISRLAALCRQAEFSPRISQEPHSPFEVEPELPVHFQKIGQNLWTQLRGLNAEINKAKPWELIQQGNRAEATLLLQKWVTELDRLVLILGCFVPQAGEKIRGLLAAGLETHQEILFPR